MDMSTIIIAALAVVAGALYLARRRSRMRSDSFE
jgi:LPXTG-motif cell wall-anchored protein